ncbi:Histone deacetylase HDT3 [Cardamine amara subsp. amara]|uniref:Histone deacetylase HDT3 n=1 Tax=Cardamine amara subsp. amara TaxID=228776 RepID=A0ABD1AJ81_CARAN
MEFWGVEVKPNVPLHVEPGENMLVHISQVSLGENTNKGNEPIRIYLKVGDQKLIIGTLSHEKFPQLATEIVLERDFDLSHSWKNGSVFFSGYKVDASETDDMTDDEPVVASNKAVANSGVKQVNFKVPDEDVKAKQDDDDSDEESTDDSEDDSEISGDEEEKKVPAEADSGEDDEDDSSDEDEDDSSDDETPKKPEEPKKRAVEAESSKKPTSNKKAKFVTPQKTESKKPHVHIATPHPSKASKNSGSSNGEASKQQQTPKSAGAFGCKTCNRSFTSEMGLQSHTKAKHSAAA